MEPDSDNASQVESVAFHFIQAGAPFKAVPQLIRAGNRAYQRAAVDQAVYFYQAALNALPDSSLQSQQNRSILEKSLAAVYVQTEQHAQAIPHFHTALGLADEAQDRIEISRQLGDALSCLDRKHDAASHLSRALDWLDEEGVAPESALRGRVLASCADIKWKTGEYDRAQECARQALDILGDSREFVCLEKCYRVLSYRAARQGKHAQADDFAAKAARARVS
jgi:tetratricopeptide (TPR) repeat protein